MVYLYAGMLAAWFGDEFNGNITGIQARNIWTELIEYAAFLYRGERIQSLEDWYRSIWDIVNEEECAEHPSLEMMANIIHSVNFNEFVYSGNIQDIFNHAPITLQRRFIDYLSRDTITRQNDEEEEYNCESGEDSDQQEHYYMEVDRGDDCRDTVYPNQEQQWPDAFDNEIWSDLIDEEESSDESETDDDYCDEDNETQNEECTATDARDDSADYIELLQSDLDALDDDFDVDSMPDLVSISDIDDDNVRYFDDTLSEIGDESSCLQLSAISCK